MPRPPSLEVVTPEGMPIGVPWDLAEALGLVGGQVLTAEDVATLADAVRLCREAARIMREAGA